MKKMQEIIHFMAILGLVIALIGFNGCSSDSSDIQKRQEYAERQTVVLCDALLHNASLDSIRAIAEQQNDVFFYVFDAQQMLYWSSNRISSDVVYLSAYDTWRDKTFSNAQAKVRWSRAGIFNVLTVIPVSYTELTDFESIDEIASNTFSFREVLTTDSKTYPTSRLYFILCHVLFGLIILIGIIVLIRNRGFRNMRLSTRITYIILAPVLAVFIYVFFMSISYQLRTTAEKGTSNAFRIYPISPQIPVLLGYPTQLGLVRRSVH
jgi:hypothetical protein